MKTMLTSSSYKALITNIVLGFILLREFWQTNDYAKREILESEEALAQFAKYWGGGGDGSSGPPGSYVPDPKRSVRKSTNPV